MALKNTALRKGSRALLWRRIAELEAEVQECRALNLRVAELTDVVVELLVPLAGSDDPRVAEIVDRYRRSLHNAPDAADRP